MARYGYGYRGGYTYNGVPSDADEWNKASYASDHVCRPVIIDAEGRKMPVIVCSPNHNAQTTYVARVETIAEHVRIPLVSEYTYGSPPKVEPLKNYGYRHSSPPKAEPEKDYYGYRQSSPPKAVHVKGYRPSSPPDEEPEDSHSYRRSSPSPPKVYGYKAQRVKDYGFKPQPVQDYRYKAEPAKGYGYKVEPVKYNKYDDDKWGRSSSPARDRPQEVEDFINKVQTEASQLPNRFGSLGVPSRGQTPQLSGQNGVTGYGGISDSSNKYLQKPSGNTIRNENYDDYYRKNDTPMEPTMLTNGGWARPSRSAWAAPPTNESTLTKPTSDIATAVKNLKEAVKALSVTDPPTQSRYTVPVSTVPKRDTYPETIDSREAARRYANFSLSSRPRTTGDTYTTTIDSREAAKMYGGANIA